MPTLDYDIAIATANRQELLSRAVRTMLVQTRRPRKIVIIDASKDHQATRSGIERLRDEAPCEIKLVYSAVAAASVQRNLALVHCEAAVVFFPDDDSFWFNDTAEHVMKIYEADRDRKIGGVAQVESVQSPYALDQADQKASGGRPTNRLKYRLAVFRNRMLKYLLAPPLDLCGEALLARQEIPDWLESLNARPIPYEIGFRMSFRAESIRRYGFNQVLHQPRCAWEDVDASFSVLHDQLLVEATRDRVYHHRAGGRRAANGIEQGLNGTLNPTYIVCRHSPPKALARRALKRYFYYFLVETAVARGLSKFQRNKIRGIRRGIRAIADLVTAAPNELDQRYEVAFARGLGQTISGTATGTTAQT